MNLTDDERTVLTSLYGDLEEHGVYRLIRPGNRGPLITSRNAFSVRDSTCVDRGAPAGIHIPTDVGSLIDRVHLAPACTYPLRRAVLDVTERFGLNCHIITEAEFDLAPFDRVKFV